MPQFLFPNEFGYNLLYSHSYCRLKKNIKRHQKKTMEMPNNILRYIFAEINFHEFTSTWISKFAKVNRKLVYDITRDERYICIKCKHMLLIQFCVHRMIYHNFYVKSIQIPYKKCKFLNTKMYVKAETYIYRDIYKD